MGVDPAGQASGWFFQNPWVSVQPALQASVDPSVAHENALSSHVPLACARARNANSVPHVSGPHPHETEIPLAEVLPISTVVHALGASAAAEVVSQAPSGKPSARNVAASIDSIEKPPGAP